MAVSSRATAATALFLLATALNQLTSVTSIGVNYGTLGNNLPPPAQVAQFLKEKTTIDRIKIFDVNHEILNAFADTGIYVAITIPNGEIPSLTDIANAKKWVETNIKPFPKTKINYILMGNEILHWGPQPVIDNLVGAMKTVHSALVESGITDIKVTTAHSLGILEVSEPPSQAKFRPGWDKGILSQMLQYHRETKSPFMVNPYPYFGYSPEKADFLLFKAKTGVIDIFSKKMYMNMFDLLLDSVYTSMKKLGYGDVDIVAGETGWASVGEGWETTKCTLENAVAYNGGLVKNYVEGKGTPLMPNKRFETYIFGLFNENTKPGSAAERNFGLFRPDFTPVYDVGIMRASGALPQPLPGPTGPAPVRVIPVGGNINKPAGPGNKGGRHPVVKGGNNKKNVKPALPLPRPALPRHHIKPVVPAPVRVLPPKPVQVIPPKH